MTTELIVACVSGLVALFSTVYSVRLSSRFQKEIEEVKSALEERLMVRKMQFEAEFNVYKQTWKPLVDLIEAARDLRRAGKLGGEERSLEERAEKVDELSRGFLDSFFYERPFVPEKVFQQCIEIQKAINREWNEAVYGRHDVEMNEARRKRYFEGAESFARTIESMGDDLCAALRVRMHTGE